MTDRPAADGEPAARNVAATDWRAELEAGRFGRAYRAFALSGDDDPDVRQALSGLADVDALVKDKAWSRGVKRLERIERRPPIVPWHELEADLACLARSGEALDRRRPEDALTELGMLQGGWWQAEADTQRGTALIYDDRIEEASAAFQRALERDPGHYRALTNLGNLALEDGRTDEAIEAYERALTLNESFANAHHNLAVAYRRKGQVGRSVRSLRRAQRLMQRRDADDARERLGSLNRPGSVRFFRWLLYAGLAIALYLVLHARGML